MELPLRFAHMWWEGFKVFCRWLAFWIVLCVLWLPIGGLVYLIGANSVLSVAVTLVLAPIPFYLTAKYLLFLDNGGEAVTQTTDHPTDRAGRKRYGLRMKIVIAMAIACSIGFPVTPDLLSGLIVGAPAALLCGISLWILSRFKFLKSSSALEQTLVCTVACLVAMLAEMCFVITPQICRHARVSSDAPGVTTTQSVVTASPSTAAE